MKKLRPDAQLMGWNPGISKFYGHGTLGSRYPDFTYNNWNGWDPRVLKNWQGSMASMTGDEEASVILSGPFYVVEPKWTDNDLPNGTVLKPMSRTIATWEQMMHTDILNFTGGNKSRVRGAELVAWGDASGTGSGKCTCTLPHRLISRDVSDGLVVITGNLVSTLAAYMTGFAVNLWAPNGTVKPTDPDSTHGMPCNGNDYSLCSELDDVRCRNMMRGIPGGVRFRSFGAACSGD